jgi:DNA-binding NarL/FixJ family response regulator
VDELLRDAPSVEHARALYALAVGSALDEQLLGAMLDLPAQSAAEMFAWLRALPFVEHRADALILHALVRTALFDDLARRDPERLRRMLDRALELVARQRRSHFRDLVASNDAGPSSTTPVGLTERQRVVLSVLLSGKSNKEIALLLRCSESTVEFHVTTLLRKHDVTSRTELMAKLLPNWG